MSSWANDATALCLVFHVESGNGRVTSRIVITEICAQCSEEHWTRTQHYTPVSGCCQKVDLWEDLERSGLFMPCLRRGQHWLMLLHGSHQEQGQVLMVEGSKELYKLRFISLYSNTFALFEWVPDFQLQGIHITAASMSKVLQIGTPFKSSFSGMN